MTFVGEEEREKEGCVGVHWGPDVIHTRGLCMQHLVAAERKGCQMRVAVLSISSASVSGTLLPCRNYGQACTG